MAEAEEKELGTDVSRMYWVETEKTLADVR
jgi:hypothetical protein